MIPPDVLTKIGFTLVNACRVTRATKLHLDLKNVQLEGESLGDWKVDVQRKGAPEWIVWSNEHRSYWGPNHRGYVSSRASAGRYSYEEALEIVRGANEHKDPDDEPNEAMIFVGNESHDEGGN